MNKLDQKILLTGGSGRLGSNIKSSESFQNLLSPQKTELNITEEESVKEYFLNNDFDILIHTAALARMGECEVNPLEAIKINILGTSKLVNSVFKKQNQLNKEIKFIYISTDGVYKSSKGGYSETSETTPYNFYGWTKLQGELAVSQLNDYCIIRTRFFDSKNITYKKSANDIFSSSLEVKSLVKKIAKLIEIDFKGIINIGEKRMSDYERYRQYVPNLNSCSREEIIKDLDYEISIDASMNLSLSKKLNI